MKLIFLILAAVLLSSCATYQYHPEDARLATTLAASSYLQYFPTHREEAVTGINVAVSLFDSYKGTQLTLPTPALFTAELQKRLPANETKSLLVSDLSAIYTRFYPKTPVTLEGAILTKFRETLDQIELGLKDALVPFAGP